MKKLILTIVVIFSISRIAHAQWAISGINTYYNLTGNVGIGANSFAAKFAVYQSTALGSVAKNNLLLSSIGGSAANNVQNNLWLVRNAAGSDFTTARLHDGISIDGSYLTPQSNTLTWWERDPTVDIQSWGNSANTYMTINKGNIGIGTTTPNAKLDISGMLLSSGGSANLDVADPVRGNISYLSNSGKILIGWNRNAGAGETDFISNQGGGNQGGFAFYNYDNSGAEKQLMWIQGNGNVGIGTPDPKGYKLAVNGSAIATSMTVKLNSAWPDYVFKKDYALPTLSEVKTYIDQNQHLPEMPSAQEIAKDGLNLGEINKLLMKKVEELTLYLIEKDDKDKQQQEQINVLNKKVDLLINKLKSTDR
jgi:hypothetical protein